MTVVFPSVWEQLAISLPFALIFAWLVIKPLLKLDPQKINLRQLLKPNRSKLFWSLIVFIFFPWPYGIYWPVFVQTVFFGPLALITTISLLLTGNNPGNFAYAGSLDSANAISMYVNLSILLIISYILGCAVSKEKEKK